MLIVPLYSRGSSIFLPSLAATIPTRLHLCPLINLSIFFLSRHIHILCKYMYLFPFHQHKLYFPWYLFNSFQIFLYFFLILFFITFALFFVWDFQSFQSLPTIFCVLLSFCAISFYMRLDADAFRYTLLIFPGQFS